MWRRRETQQTVITPRSASQRRAQVEVSVRRPFGYICVKVCVVVMCVQVIKSLSGIIICNCMNGSICVNIMS